METNLNRRQMLAASAASILGLPMASAAIPDLPPEPKWFTHNQLMYIYNTISQPGKGTKETNRELFSDNLPLWNGKPLSRYESFYLSLMRVSNIMHRKTLVSNHPWWIVFPPKLVLDVLPDFTISEKWHPDQGWRNHIREEVTPGVYRIGTLNCRWAAYVDENFPKDVAMVGMGYKTVQRFTYDKNATPGPEAVRSYMGPPTEKYYGLVICER